MENNQESIITWKPSKDNVMRRNMWSPISGIANGSSTMKTEH